MLAYKFLKAGAIGPFSGLPWAPDEWVEASGELDLGRNGVHACTASALPYWIADELWRIELDGDVVEAEGVVVARRGRLTEHVSGWNADALHASGREDTTARAADARRYAGQPISAVNVACCSYIGARAADEAGPAGWDRERAWQATWLADRLRLQLP